MMSGSYLSKEERIQWKDPMNHNMVQIERLNEKMQWTAWMDEFNDADLNNISNEEFIEIL